MLADGTELVVSMRRIQKSFHGVPVLREVNFDVRRGEVHALVGENGAGKSTLMKILQGVYSTDDGQVVVDGLPRQFKSSHDARAAGIGMVFQEFSLVSSMTVAQNISLGREPRNRLGLVDDRETRRRARAVFAQMDVRIDPRAKLFALSTAYWQLTEIAKALGQDARVLIMDEPTASLESQETERLFDLVRRLKGRGISIIYISHRLDEIFRIADRVTVLRDGGVVATAPIDAVSPPELIEMIVGRHMEGALDWRPREVARIGEPLLQVRGLNAKSGVRDVSFDVYAGEVVGLAGLMGSGRSELLRCLFGIDPAVSGDVLLRGKRVVLKSAQQAISARLALIPEDRRAQGLILDHSVRDNLLLPLLKGLRQGPLLDEKRSNVLTDRLIRRFNVKVRDPRRPVRLLSGGNQQKVVIAKWLATEPDLLLMDEPTAGVDIGTKAEIVAMIRKLATDGKAVILVSSELAELLAVSDRVLVMREGRIVDELLRAHIPDERSLQLSVQGVIAS